MTNAEAVNWLINITADIGKAEHSDLWHYEQALSEIREMLEDAQPQRMKGRWIGYAGTIGAECSECHKWIDVIQGTAEMNYCPNCGAEMETEQQ